MPAARATVNAGRVALSVQVVLGSYGPDVNPHFWYDLQRVPRVASAIEAALARLDPPDAKAFSAKPGGLRCLAAAGRRGDRAYPPAVPGRAGRQLEDLIDLARSAVTAQQAHRSRELLDTITTRLFQLGLNLQAAIDLPADMVRQRIEEALEHLDDTIREIRDTAFTTPDQTPPRPSPPDGAGPASL